MERWINTGRVLLVITLLAGLVGQTVPDQLNLVIRGDETAELGWVGRLRARFILWESEPASLLWIAVRE